MSPNFYYLITLHDLLKLPGFGVFVQGWWLPNNKKLNEGILTFTVRKMLGTISFSIASATCTR